MNDKIRYKCLIIDHDDTAVSSTPEIHYPAHCEVLRVLRPSHPIPSLETWYLKNFDPGISEYLAVELGLSNEELLRGFEMWHNATIESIPSFFPGVLDLLREFRNAGGKVVVVSHSERDLIERDYRAASDRNPFVPDLIYGWNHDETRRKPHPWPVLQALETFQLQPAEAVIVDDLKPGVQMGRAAGIPVVAAGWGHKIPVIRSYMESSCDAYFETVEDFRNYLMGVSGC